MGGQNRVEPTTGHPSKAFDRFEGNIILVDLATDVKGSEEYFNGSEWLHEQLRNQCPIGFDMEWKPDRFSGSDNHVALMQLANAETALLLRTHRRRHWLPKIVKDVLTSPLVPKITVGYDGADRRKLESSFGFLLEGVIDLSDLAIQKGLRHTGLKKLAEDFGWHMKKESLIARSDWQQFGRLSKAQIEYAAEDAYFTFMIYWKLKEIPNAAPAEPVEARKVISENRSCLILLPGWSEQAIEQRSDGMWCALCDKGPMVSSDVVVKHITSKMHRRKADAVGLDDFISDVQQDPVELDEALGSTPQASTFSSTSQENSPVPSVTTAPSISEFVSLSPELQDCGDTPIQVGSIVRALANVTIPPPDWNWHPSTYLISTVDDDIEVLSHDGEWLYGCCGKREGWILRTTVRHVVRPLAETCSQGDAAQIGVSFGVEEKIATAQVDVLVPPPSWCWRPDDFLTLAAGDSVQILGEDSGWLYGRCGHRAGWFHESTLQSEQGQSQSIRLANGMLQANLPVEEVTCHDDSSSHAQQTRDESTSALGGLSADIQSSCNNTYDVRRESSLRSEEQYQRGLQDHRVSCDGSSDLDARKGRVECVQHAVTEPPFGMSPCNFLMVSIGEYVHLEHAEDGWFWGQTDGRRAWIPAWAFEREHFNENFATVVGSEEITTMHITDSNVLDPRHSACNGSTATVLGSHSWGLVH